MKKYIFKTLLLLGACFASTACSEDDQYIPYGLSLSQYEYVFPAEGGQLTITVQTAYPKWDAQFDVQNGWLTETERTDHSITLSAAPNATEADHALTITFTAGELKRETVLAQEKPAPVPPNFRILESAIMAISPNGDLLVTYDRDETDNSLNFYTINTLTDERKLYMSTTEDITSVNAISNDGSVWAAAFGGAGLSNDKYIVNGEIKDVELPAGYINPSICDLSADGKIMVGAAYDPQTQLTAPVKWTDGKPRILDAPEKSRVEEMDLYGNYAVAVSSDGNFILGRAFTGSQGEAFFWKGDTWKWLGPTIEKEVEIVPPMGGDPLKVPYTFTTTIGPNEVGKISPNGKYAAVNFQDWGQNMMGWSSTVSVPGLFDVESEEMVAILDGVMESSLTGGIGITATDEGGLFYTTNIHDLVSPAYYWLGGTSTETKIMIENLVGYHVGSDLRIRKIVDNPLRIIGTYSHAEGIDVPFYIRVSDTEPGEE